MIALINIAVAFFFSFIGTIPPGTINLIILQLGLENKIKIAWRFALAAALIEYPYAWLAVKFEAFITSSPLIVENIQLITAVVMTVLGIFNLISVQRPSKFSEKFNNSGFRRGLILGILNPLAIPFWVGTTAYLNGQRWIDLSTPPRLHSYLLGISLGTLTLLIILAYLAQKIVTQIQHKTTLQRIPGIVLLGLGLYAFFQYLF
jgi:threonine/homoserine/homoserine lactone efflux protein